MLPHYNIRNNTFYVDRLVLISLKLGLAVAVAQSLNRNQGENCYTSINILT